MARPRSRGWCLSSLQLITTMNLYQKAAEALSQAVKQSIDDNVDSNLQSEIWRHYQGMQSIAKQLGKGERKSDLGAFDSIMDAYDPDYNINVFSGSHTYGAAQPVNYLDYLSSEGKDVITFS